MSNFEYNTGNIEKYHTKNPLKRRMVSHLNSFIIDSINQWVSEHPTTNNHCRILDAGCGEGFITRLIHRSFPDAEVIGLEYTSEAIEIANKNCPDIDFKQGTIYELPFPEHSFDIVLCTEVLEHLEKPDLALSELERVSNRYLLITVPNEPWFCLGNLLSLHNVSRLGNPIDHINHWTKYRFERYLKDRFFEKAEVTVCSCFPWTAAKIVK